jgi:DnaJ-domain-containing protein 1
LSLAYSPFAILSGSIILLPTAFLMYVAVKIVILLIFPTFHFATLVSCIIALLGVGLIYADAIHAEREDMSYLPSWLVREFLHAGPRLTMDGGRHFIRAIRFMRLDLKMCENAFSYIVARRTSVSKTEMIEAIAGLDWPKLLAQLRLFEGVLILRADMSRLSFIPALRQELQRLSIPEDRQNIPKPEPEPVPVNEPEHLSPCEILGVGAEASIAEIKVAYRNRVKLCHPDHFASMDEGSRMLAEEWTKALNAAYESLVSEKRNETNQKR